MEIINDAKVAKTYLGGMLWAAFGVNIVSESVAEWQLYSVKEYAWKFKEDETEHSTLTSSEKKNQKKLWKQWIDETVKGFKEVWMREGRQN